jgi:hypothetical protein
MSYMIFATTYTCGAYGAGGYDTGLCSAAGTNSSTSVNGRTGISTGPAAGSNGSLGRSTTVVHAQRHSDIDGTLAKPGFDVLLFATVAATLIFLALLIRFWRRRHGKH